MQEDIPGVLVVRVRESLNFGACPPYQESDIWAMLTPDPLSTANTGQLKERLRRLELYGPGKAHPSEAPRRDEATVLVIHAADMETIDASYVRAPVERVALLLTASIQPLPFTVPSPFSASSPSRTGRGAWRSTSPTYDLSPVASLSEQVRVLRFRSIFWGRINR